MSSRFVLTMSGSIKLLRVSLAACALLALSTGCDSATSSEPPALPEPDFDQVGLPANYATTFMPFYVLDRPDNRQVRVVYANDAAIAGVPFKRGSILVMETWAAKLAQGRPVLGADGRFQRDTIPPGIFVMRKERWFGRRYKEHQTGEWEYASFSPAGMPRVVGDAGAQSCAICHLDAGAARDWVYRADIHFANGTATVPQPPAGQLVNEPFIDNYTYVPATITVPVGTRITWTNRDQVKHTVTASNGAFSVILSQGAVSGRPFTTAGTFEYFCAFHLGMRGTVVVVPASASHSSALH
jgi:plastocyanin